MTFFWKIFFQKIWSNPNPIFYEMFSTRRKKYFRSFLLGEFASIVPIRRKSKMLMCPIRQKLTPLKILIKNWILEILVKYFFWKFLTMISKYFTRIIWSKLISERSSPNVNISMFCFQQRRSDRHLSNFFHTRNRTPTTLCHSRFVKI